jgi:protein disulfide-isomerase A1
MIEREATITATSYRFYRMSEAMGLKLFPEAKPFPCVIIMKDRESEYQIYRPSFSRTEFRDTLKDLTYPLIGQPSIRNMDAVTKDSRKIAFILYARNDEDQVKGTLFELRETIPDRKYIFLEVAPGDPMIDWLGLTGKPTPAFMIVDKQFGEVRKFIYEDKKFELKDLQEFIELWKAGNATRFIKSEAEPIDNPGPVFKTTANSFKKDVLDENYEAVIVKNYAPWCPHCQKLVPIYEELARMFPRVKFLEYDGTKNEVVGYSSDQYPDVRLFVGKERRMIRHPSDATKENLVNFIKTKAGIEPYSTKKAEGKVKADL